MIEFSEKNHLTNQHLYFSAKFSKKVKVKV